MDGSRNGGPLVLPVAPSKLETRSGPRTQSPFRRTSAPRRRAWYLLLETSGHPGWYNMAGDQGLLDLAEQESAGFVRLYRWDPPCLSFGRHEPALSRYDRDRILSLGLDTVRRPTGGRAVWHSTELTYAVAAPTAWFGSARAAYRAIHTTLAAALASFGILATRAPRRCSSPGLEAGPCFAHAVGGELLVQGRKVAGSAQLVQGKALLQHGSLLLEDEQWVVTQLLRGIVPNEPGRGAAPRRALPLGFEAAAHAVAAQIRSWPGRWHEEAGNNRLQAAAAYHVDRFRSAAWTWRR